MNSTDLPFWTHIALPVISLWTTLLCNRIIVGERPSPSAHWTEIARWVYTFSKCFSICRGIALCCSAIFAISSNAGGFHAAYPALAITLLIHYPAMYVARILIWNKRTGWFDWLRQMVIYDVCYLIPWLLLFFLFIETFQAFDVLTAIVVTSATGISFNALFLILLKALGLLSGSSSELAKLVTSLAGLSNMTPSPRVFVLRTKSCGAFAHKASRSVLLTQGTLELLSEAELSSVIQHELAHLREARSLQWIPYIALAMLGIALALTSHEIASLALAPVLIAFFSFLAPRWIHTQARRSEEKADQLAIRITEDPTAYALALEKAYKANLIPAVLRDADSIHPNLYDRMLSAGVTPPYPRPKPPLQAAISISSGLGCSLLLTGYITAQIVSTISQIQWIKAPSTRSGFENTSYRFGGSFERPSRDTNGKNPSYSTSTTAVSFLRIS